MMAQMTPAIQIEQERDVEHMIVEDGESMKCVLLPTDGEPAALATEWIEAEAGAYVPLSEMQ